MQLEVLNRCKISVFFLKLFSRTSSKRENEAIEILKKDYPYEINKENVFILNNKNRNCYICLIVQNPKKMMKYISTTLYAKNHFKSLTGTVSFNLKEFNEAVEMENGNITSSSLFKGDSSIGDESKITIDSQKLYESYNDRDVIKREDKKNLLRKRIAELACFIIICVILALCSYKKIKMLNAQKEENKILMLQKEEENKAKEKNEKTLLGLEAEYDEIKKEEYEDVYDYICAIYNCVEKGSVIENLSIEKNSFSVEVTTKDAIKILERFESESKIINEIKMNRTVIQDGTEHVTYTGVFAKKIKKPDADDSISDKIDFYKNEIAKANQILEQMNKVSISEYTKNIRERLHACSCMEQYLQYKADNQMAVLECLVNSTSGNILQFLSTAGKGESPLDISSIRIRNSSDPANMQTTIRFWTGISKKENENFGSFDFESFSPNEISSVFFKKKAAPPASTKQISTRKKVEQKAQTITVLKSKNLKYIGRTVVKGETIIIIKDTEMNILYKLPLLDTLSTGNCCSVATNGKYNAVIKGVVYEVNE